MRLRTALGVAFGVSVAIACSSNPASNLNGSPGSSSGGGNGADGGCAPMGTAASDGAGYVKKEGCQSCHGANMAGSSTPLVTSQEPGLVVANGDRVYPANLTPDMATGIGSWTALEIAYGITEGIDNNGQDLCPEMGRHYPNMCEDEVTGIVAYLQSIPAVSNQVPASYCPPDKCGSVPCGVDAGN